MCRASARTPRTRKASSPCMTAMSRASASITSATLTLSRRRRRARRHRPLLSCRRQAARDNGRDFVAIRFHVHPDIEPLHRRGGPAGADRERRRRLGVQRVRRRADGRGIDLLRRPGRPAQVAADRARLQGLESEVRWSDSAAGRPLTRRMQAPVPAEPRPARFELPADVRASIRVPLVIRRRSVPRGVHSHGRRFQEHSGARSRARPPRAALGVRQDRAGRVRRRAVARPASSWSRPAAPPRRSRRPASRSRDVSERDRLPRDHGRPRQDAASGDPWRHARRSRRCRPRRAP